MTDSADAANTLAGEWDERYTGLTDHLPGLKPNQVLIDSVSPLRPGRALDIGCGSGAEAVWLACRGWDVTALDVSAVALEHASRRATEAGVQVHWLRSRLEDADTRAGQFDLVTAFYPALLHSPDKGAQRALLAAVAPGGTLLVVHHADVDVEKAKSYGFDPADYLSHDDVAGLLGDDWHVQIERRRPRETPAGLEGQHTRDDVVLARRLR
jgi:2-polyprenyl-3-methyl-5-hydroxy-6-metoxy-1,4-benzoquinol methylase